MKLQEKIGQLIMIGFSGIKLNRDTKSFLKKNHIGGIILFERNYESLSQLVELNKELHSLADRFPILIAVDQEGGRVTRLKKPFTQFPAPLSIGDLFSQKDDSVKITYEVGCILGRELNAVGINMNLAPVLDLYSNPDNPVIGDRSYGNDPIKVSKIGLSIVAGLQDNYVIACGKHFPGHGDTSRDSHRVLPILEHDLQRLLSMEIKPFSHVIKNGILSIMSGHLKFPKIDKSFPASLSEVLIGTLLRKNLRFTGIAISDDLCMGAISRNYSVPEAAVQCIKAGSDIVLVSNDLGIQEGVYKALLNAAGDGILTETKINASLARITRIKERFLQRFVPDLKATKEIIGCRAHRQFSGFLYNHIKEVA